MYARKPDIQHLTNSSWRRIFPYPCWRHRSMVKCRNGNSLPSTIHGWQTSRLPWWGGLFHCSPRQEQALHGCLHSCQRIRAGNTIQLPGLSRRAGRADNACFRFRNHAIGKIQTTNQTGSRWTGSAGKEFRQTHETRSEHVPLHSMERRAFRFPWCTAGRLVQHPRPLVWSQCLLPVPGSQRHPVHGRPEQNGWFQIHSKNNRTKWTSNIYSKSTHSFYSSKIKKASDARNIKCPNYFLVLIKNITNVWKKWTKTAIPRVDYGKNK